MISWPSKARAAGRQAFTDVHRLRPDPSGRATSTAQAPHSPSAQPSLAPISPSALSQSSNRVCGLTPSQPRTWPLTVIWITLMAQPPQCPPRGRPGQPLHLPCQHRQLVWFTSYHAIACRRHSPSKGQKNGAIPPEIVPPWQLRGTFPTTTLAQRFSACPLTL